MSTSISDVYCNELLEAQTENLLGKAPVLHTLVEEPGRANFYVQSRIDSESNKALPNFHFESRLHHLFWPPLNAKQLVQIVGCAGTGKSTFLRYYFQHYLPEIAFSNESRAVRDSGLNDVSKHIVLYCDMRFPIPGDLSDFVYDKLARSLRATMKLRGLDNELQSTTEERGTARWLLENLWKLAQAVNPTGERRFYVSWVLDNLDQLAESMQLQLLQFVYNYIPQEPPGEWSPSPVTSEERMLWRIIVPVRPETSKKLQRFLEPFHNRDELKLEPVDSHLLICARAKLLLEAIIANGRHFAEDVFVPGVPRDYFELLTPEENGKCLYDSLMEANRLWGENRIAGKTVRRIVKMLANGAARRCLRLLPKVAVSRVFRERNRIGKILDWTEPVSAFYFLDGMIRGDALFYEPNQKEALILNLYDLGAYGGSPRSMLIGVHCIYLLSRGSTWDDARNILTDIGYGKEDIGKLESELIDKELIRDIGEGKYLVEHNVAKGHFRLLKERAYTDNMAITSARSWNLKKRVAATDPLNFDELITRLKGSLWFMERICTSQSDLKQEFDRVRFRYRDPMSLRSRVMSINIGRIVTTEYLARAQKLPDYPKPSEAINAARPQWDKFLGELQKLATRMDKVGSIDDSPFESNL